jgi:hypothetical protein
MGYKTKREFLDHYNTILGLFEGSVEDLDHLNIWDILLEFEEFSLIKKVYRAGSGQAGFGTLIVPEGGFCSYPHVNSAVIQWLEYKGVNVVDVNKEITDLKNCLLN